MKKIILLLASLLCSSLALASENKSWDDVVAQAKKEGTVTFNVWYLQPRWRTFIKQFETQYGIKVVIPEGTLDGNVNKLLAESGLKKGKIDVIGLSVGQFPAAMTAKSLIRISDMPGYTSAIHQVQNVDTGGFAVAYWGNQTGFAYDPQQMGQQPLPQSLEDLQRFIDKNPGRFGYNDPNNGGAGEAFIQRIVTLKGGDFNSNGERVDPQIVKNWEKGWQWFAANKDKIILTSSGADSLTRLNDGELWLIAAWEDHLRGLQTSGAITPRLKFYIPEFNMPGGGNIAGIAANAPHPAAAQVFLNWLIQPDIQKALGVEFGARPMISQPAAEQQTQTPLEFYGKAYSMALKKAFVRQVMMR